MNKKTYAFLSAPLVGLIALTLACPGPVFAAAAAGPPFVVVAADSNDGATYTVNFSGAGSVTTLNSNPTGAGAGIAALAFLPGANGATPDLLAANAGGSANCNLPTTASSEILRLSAAAQFAAAPFWQYCDAGVGPVTALALDGAGDVYAAGVDPGPQTAPMSVWVFTPPYSGFPLAVDYPNSESSITGQGGHVGSIADTTLVGAAGAAASKGLLTAGDLLVLVGDPVVYSSGQLKNGFQPVVIRYPAASLAAGLAAGTFYNVDGVNVSNPSILFTFSSVPFVDGEAAVSMDFNPLDGSLLVATSVGNIYKISFATGAPTTTLFASGFLSAGGALQKVRAAVWGTTPYVFATESNTLGAAPGGSIDVFSGAPGGTAPYFTAASTKVAGPSGGAPGSLAIFGSQYPTVTGLASNCVYPNTCDLLGGVINTQITGTAAALAALAQFPNATVTQSLCVVHKDPRGANCGANPALGIAPQSLPLKNVCPGMSDTTIIPDYLCGSAGDPTAPGQDGTGFVIVAGLGEQVDGIDGLLVSTDATSNVSLPYAGDPSCPQNVALYTYNDHSAVETTFPEGHYGFELTSSCDPTKKKGPGLSIDGVGFALVPSGSLLLPRISPNPLVNLAQYKFDNLFKTIAKAPIQPPLAKATLLACAAWSDLLLLEGHNACAAETVYKCDRFVANHPADFPPLASPTPTKRAPNPYGDIRGRLGNLFLTIDTRILGQTPYTDWPLPSDPNLCKTKSDMRDY